MAINPDDITTARVGQLPPASFSLTDLIPHEVGTVLSQGTIQSFADFLAAYIDTTGAVSFRPVTVLDGQTLPDTTELEWILVGKGTFINVNGGADITTTEELNALMSNGTYWFIGVEIPIEVEGIGYTPESIANKISEITTYSEVLYPNEKAVHDLADTKLNITDLPSNLTLYPTTTASAIGGYFKMVTSPDDPDYDATAVNVSTGSITTTAQLISSLVAPAGTIIGQPGIINITTIGNIRRVSGSGTADFYFELYHRNLAGTETFIGVSNPTMPITNSVYGQFSTTAVWNDGTFLETDTIVIKYYANRIAGGVNPVYEFQFGGLTPVRSIVPVSFNVLAGDYELKANKQNDLTPDGTGVKYPTVDAVNDSLSNIKKQFEHTFVKESKPRNELSEYVYSGTVRTVGSGGTYATITAAFNAAVSGDILQLADGVYDTAAESGGYLLFNSTTKRILIRGNSTNNASVIIRQSAAATYCVRVRTSNELSFKDLTIESNQNNTTLVLNQDTSASPVTVFFDNCVIKNNGTDLVRTIYLQGFPVNSCKFEFFKCDIYQNSNASSVFLRQDNVSDAASLLYTIPVILNKCNLFGNFIINGSTNLSMYDSYLSCFQNNTIFQIGEDTAVPSYFNSKIDVRNCFFTYTGSFTKHGVLLGRGTKNVYFVNNHISMASGNNVLSLGLVIKSIGINVDDVIIEGNYIEAPRPLYIKGGQYCSIRYNTTFSNWSDLTNGFGFELNNPLNVDGEISTIGNIVEFNNFSGKIAAIELSYSGTTTAIYSFNLNDFNSNKYNIPTGGNYINSPATTWEAKHLTTKNDSNSILKYY